MLLTSSRFPLSVSVRLALSRRQMLGGNGPCRPRSLSESKAVHADVHFWAAADPIAFTAELRKTGVE